MLKALQTLKSQKFSIVVSSDDIFVAVVEVHVFNRVKPLAAFELIDLVIIIDVELVPAENRGRFYVVETERKRIFRSLVNGDPVPVERE